MHLTRWLLTIALLALGTALCFAADPEPAAVANQNLINDSDVLAEYDGGVITRQELDAKISKLPPNAQGRYRTVEGQKQVLEIMAVENAFMAKALQLGIDEDPEVLDRIEAAKKQFFIQEYYKRNVGDLVVVTEEDKREYYNNNKQAFYVHPYIHISYIQAEDEASALEALEKLNEGRLFAEVSDEYNVNTYAKNLRGEIKNIRLNGNIPGVGNDYELEDHIAASEADSTRFYGPYETATGWHIFRTNQYTEGRQKSFEEVQPELDQRTRPGVEARMLDGLIESLKEKYSVVVDTTHIAQIDLFDPAKNSEIEDTPLVTSSNEELNITVKTLLENFSRMPQQEQLFYTKGEGARQLLDQELIRQLMYVDAKGQKYSKYLEDNEDFQQVKRYHILNETFRRLVVDAIEVADEETKAYYDEHPQDFTKPAKRSIEALWFDDAKTAKKALKKYKRYVKKDDTEKIDELIEEYSTKPKLARLDNIYDNGIITGIGPDEEFSQKVWDNEVGYISPVFESSRGDILFFRLVGHTPETIQSFTEVEPRISGLLRNQKQKEKQEEVTQQLFEEFNMVTYPERLTLQLSANELFDLADNSAKQRNYNDAVTYYDQIIQSYKNGSDDYRASFMKAFIIAEELKDEERALRLFREFLDTFPEGDLKESAQFMIDSIEGKVELKLED